MRKFVSLLLILAFLGSLTACGVQSSDNVEFYYQRQTYTYGAADGVIASEARDATGHAQDLRYLLALYLRGPLDENLQSPFPSGCTLTDILIEDGTLTVVLDSSFSSLTGIERTVACACLAKTCFSLIHIDQISIQSPAGEETDAFSVTIHADSLLLEDSSIQETE